MNLDRPIEGERPGAVDLSDRDQQRMQVYAWENRVVAPRDPTTVGFSAAQRVVDAIWADMGLRYPPQVERFLNRPRQRWPAPTGFRCVCGSRRRPGACCMSSPMP